MALKPLDVIVAIHDKSSCYIKSTPAKMGGIIVHSTAANNPYLKRYVDAPSAVGVNKNNNTWNMSSEKMGRQVCVHSFLGYDINNKLRVAQVHPYNLACWGNGGPRGNCNYNPNARIQFEIQEDATNNKAFLEAQLELATQYCAELCIMFGWNPTGTYNGAPVIMDHIESYEHYKGGNHSDIRHWIKKFGYTMDWFRKEVKNKMAQLDGVTIGKTTVVRSGSKGTGVPSKYANGAVVKNTPAPTTKPSTTPTTTVKTTGKFKVGDIVTFSGTNHYGSTTATSKANSSTLKTGKAKVTNVSSTGTHKYHLIGSQGGAGTGNSTVYGWVNESDINGGTTPKPTTTSTAIKKGDKVKLKTGATSYDGKKLSSFLFSYTWIVHQIANDRVVINDSTCGKQKGVMTPVKLSNLTKV